MLSKYSGVLSDIGLTKFEILSDRTNFCRTELFFHKAYNFVHIMIVGLNISMFCSKTNGQSDSSKIQCYLLFKCHLSGCGAEFNKSGGPVGHQVRILRGPAEINTLPVRMSDTIFPPILSTFVNISCFQVKRVQNIPRVKYFVLMIGLVSYNMVVLETGRGWPPFDQKRRLFTVNVILFPINKSPSYRHIVN